MMDGWQYGGEEFDHRASLEQTGSKTFSSSNWLVQLSYSHYASGYNLNRRCIVSSRLCSEACRNEKPKVLLTEGSSLLSACVPQSRKKDILEFY